MKQFYTVLITGLIIGLITCAQAISYASFIFSGSLSDYLQQGLILLVVGSAILNWVMACFNSSVKVIADPQEIIVALIALMAASITSDLIALNRPEQIFPTVVALIAISSIALGLFFFLSGTFQLNKLFRYVPFPVTAGVLAGLGWVLIDGSITVMTDQTLSVSTLQNTNFIFHLLPGVLFGSILFYCSKKKLNYILNPLANIAMPFVFIGIFWLFNIPLTDDWFIGKFFVAGTWPPLPLSELKFIHWPSILNQAGTFLALLFTTTVEFLFNLTGLELIVKKDLKFDRELKTMGLTNIVTGLFGGAGGYHSVSLSTINQVLKANGRWVEVVMGIVKIGILFAALPLFKFIPKAMVGGIIFFVGLELIYDWGFALRRMISFLEYALILTIFLTTIFFGFYIGFLSGVAIAILFFVVQYSRIDVLKGVFTGNSYKSRVDRRFEEEKYLEKHGTEVYILKLNGFLFFGTAYKLYETITEYAGSHSIRYIVIDFKSVYGMDSSSILAFKKLGYYIADKNIQLVFAGLSPTHKSLLSTAIANGETPKFFDDLDYGVEWCENDLLKGFTLDKEQTFEVSLPDILPSLKKQTFLKGEYLIHQGTSSTEMFVVQSGELSVILNLKSGEKIRIRTLLPGTLVGELSFFLDTPRSTDVVAESDSTVFIITKSDLDRIKNNTPSKFEEFQNFMIKLLSERIIKFYSSMIID